MKSKPHFLVVAALAIMSGCFGSFPFPYLATGGEEEPKGKEPALASGAARSFPDSVADARGRARWLHEAMHGALQVMHRDYFGDGDDDSIFLPSQSLDDVFAEMRRSWNVEMRWLGVNATKGVDHEPQDRFEEEAAKALLEGASEHEMVEGDRYRFVGVIHIRNECLKCHDRNRTNLDEKVAGLAISFPLQDESLTAAIKE